MVACRSLNENDEVRPAMVWIWLELDEALFFQIVDDALDVLAVRAEVAGEPRHGLRTVGQSYRTENLPPGVRRG